MLLSLLALTTLSAVATWPDDVEAALVSAGDHRPEIESVLEHYARAEDPEKLAAACFLIANMPGKGYIEYGLFDEQGNEIAFDALEHEGLGAAQTALDELEAVHGTVDFEKKALVEDLHTLTADQLRENIDLAFRGWRENAWAKDVSFETFCEYILPHRGSNEPVEAWRGPLMEALAPELAKLATAGDAAGLAAKASSQRVGFWDLYYLHPTDQGFAEMCAARRGRCEDMTNMTTYAMRAAAVVSAADYTPWWGHRDNNHAWSVTLDGEGRGKSGAGNGAAKVYRKTYSKQRANLCFQLEDGEEAPRWLDRESYLDVTDQYFDTGDVTVRLEELAGQRFAYLCVFNGGEWKPIHWGRVEDGLVTFDRMGRGLLYLPVTFYDDSIHGAAPPFFLTRTGEVQPLAASTAFAIEASFYTETGRGQKLDDDGKRLSQLKPGETYELFVWRDAWKLLGEHEAGEDPIAVERLPAGGLYWLVRKGSRKLERPFTVRDGVQAFM